MSSRFKQLLSDVLPFAARRDEGVRAEPPRAPPHQPADAGAGSRQAVLGLLLAAAALTVALGVVATSVSSAKRRLLAPAERDRPAVATAQEAELGYCTSDFKQVLERVLHSCGLSAQTERRGCKPSDIKTFAAIDDADFNALFHPLKDRGGVLMFDEGSDVLDEAGQRLLDERWFERRGARYFFVVARASKTGTPAQNRALSHRRANSVMYYLQQLDEDTPEELNQRVGLLWLGNEYAQLSEEYCRWPRSREQAPCAEEPINRSAFVSWVDCRL